MLLTIVFIAPPSINCTFQRNMCGYAGSGWTRNQGYTPTYGTGPSVDANLGIYPLENVLTL